MNKTKLDLNKINHQVLVSAVGALIDDGGHTAREVIELLDDCKNQLFFALQEMEIENREKRGKAK